MYSKNGIPWVRPPTHDGQHNIEKIILGGQNNGR